ncbi:hypothetical protein VNO77_26751 [Canavalia gladiata]|uniref:Uncharacterized protein n=1 Tax=Canavalia gladiata TaxID=3824 RepID=A0AAN9Q3L9_CANGL
MRKRAITARAYEDTTNQILVQNTCISRGLSQDNVCVGPFGHVIALRIRPTESLLMCPKMRSRQLVGLDQMAAQTAPASRSTLGPNLTPMKIIQEL